MGRYETDEEKLMAFEETMLTTKEDILEELKYKIKTLESGKNEDCTLQRHSVEFKNAYIDLLKRFHKAIDNTTLFKKLEPWWAYEFEINDNGASLHLMYYFEVTFDEEGYIEDATVTQDFELVKTSIQLLTVEQYAAKYNVTVTTVRQWIRRGKLRTAVKTGNEWRIPELCELTSRGYTKGTFMVSELLGDIPEEYSFLKDCALIHISQDEKDKNKFEICLNKRNGKLEKFFMDAKNRERFELYLISNPMIKAESETFETF